MKNQIVSSQMFWNSSFKKNNFFLSIKKEYNFDYEISFFFPNTAAPDKPNCSIQYFESTNKSKERQIEIGCIPGNDKF